MENKKFNGCDRRINSSYTNLGSLSKGFDSQVGVLTDEKQVVDGIITRKNAIKFVTPSDAISGYKVSDFSIENLSSIGAVDGLKPVKFNDIDVDLFTSQLDDIVDNL